jgi:hypothetical protein
VVSNSLRLRGYKIATVALPKTRFQKALEFAFTLAALVAILAFFTAFSFGWLQPNRGNENNGAMPAGMSYRALVLPTTPVSARTPTNLEIQIVDQAGNRFTNFEATAFDKNLYYAYIAVVPRDLSSLQAKPLLLDSKTLPTPEASGTNGEGGMGGDMSKGMSTPAAITPQGTTEITNQPVGVNVSTIQPKIVFPADGQYTIFIDFVPLGGDKVTLSVPVEVGSASAPAPSLTPDTSLTQSIGNLLISMKLSAPLKVGQPNSISFEITDAQGAVRSEEIGLRSGDRCNLYIIDESSTTFLRPELINPSNLQFSAIFPKMGKYKIWFEFLTLSRRPQQVAFVVDVK